MSDKESKVYSIHPQDMEAMSKGMLEPKELEQVYKRAEAHGRELSSLAQARLGAWGEVYNRRKERIPLVYKQSKIQKSLIVNLETKETKDESA